MKNRMTCPSLAQNTSSSTPQIKPLFPIRAKWRCLMPSDIIHINKYQPKMLSNVELAHLKLTKIGIHGIRKLSRALKETKAASSLKVHRTHLYHQNHPRLITHLLKTTNHWRKLNLDFNFSQGSHHTNNRVFKCLSHCKNLSSFEIKIAGQEKISNLLVNRISQELHMLTTLKKLHLNVGTFRHMYHTNDFTEEDDSNASILAFRYPKSLSSLHLNFPEPDFVSPQLLPRFASNIKKCPLLESFNVDFGKKATNALSLK